MFGLKFHTSFVDAYRESPKLMALSAFLSTAATQVQQPMQKWLILAGIVAGALGIMLKKDDGGEK